MTGIINGHAPNIFVPDVLTAEEREVMERIPIKDAMRDLMAQLNAELEANLKTAIEAFTGEPLTDPEVLRGRLHHVARQGDEDAGLTYFMDGVAILWVGPAAIIRQGDVLTANRSIQQLVPDRIIEPT
jgi:hypothetical protein